jgi:hypothetical protein
MILCQFHLIQDNVDNFQHLSFEYLRRISFIRLVILIDLIGGVLMPIYTLLHNLMADSVLEDTDYPEKTTMLLRVTTKL